MLRTAEYLIETADRCIRLASAGRRMADELDAIAGPDAKKEQYEHLAAAGRFVADELETLGRELMTKAVELDTQRQKDNPGTFGP